MLFKKVDDQFVKVEERKLVDLDITEKDLETWIENSSEIIGDDILIISRQLAGVLETKDRLDLLGIDSEGRLVIIELKRGYSTGKIDLQALRYTAFYEKMGFEEMAHLLSEHESISLEDAKNKITAHITSGHQELEDESINKDQRIILIAQSFDPGVTSTVLWLINHGINITCITLNCYEENGQLYFSPQQIVPLVSEDDLRVTISDPTDISKQIRLARPEVITFMKSLQPKFNELGLGKLSYNPRKHYAHFLRKNRTKCVIRIYRTPPARVELFFETGEKRIKDKMLHELNNFPVLSEKYQIQEEGKINPDYCRVRHKIELGSLEQLNSEQFVNTFWKGLETFLKDTKDFRDKVTS